MSKRVVCRPRAAARAEGSLRVKRKAASAARIKNEDCFSLKEGALTGSSRFSVFLVVIRCIFSLQYAGGAARFLNCVSERLIRWAILA